MRPVPVPGGVATGGVTSIAITVATAFVGAPEGVIVTVSPVRGAAADGDTETPRPADDAPTEATPGRTSDPRRKPWLLGGAALVSENDSAGLGDGVRQVVDVRTGRELAEFRDVWNTEDCAGSTEGAPHTFDRAGNRIDTKLPGVIIASSGDLVLAADVAYNDTTSLHDVSGVAVYQLSR